MVIADDTDGIPPQWIAPGGWRRALVSFVLGALLGALVALVMPRDERPSVRD